ncbi:MAG: Uncharacterised protein [Cyanobium sp. ARS6]|nr:MAG: Uncharacterised protein [Cyanobium sp. ARS6]
MGNASHHALHQSNVGGILQRAEAQSIQQSDRTSTHGEDVAEDSTDTCGCSLKGFHRRGMVVALNLEGKAMASSKIHHTGVFSGTHQDARPLSRKATEQRSGIAITTVLGPHHSEHAEFSPVGVTAQPPLNLDVILLGEPFLAEGGLDIKCLSRRRRLDHSQQVIYSQCCRQPVRDQSDPGITIPFHRPAVLHDRLAINPVVVSPILQWI